MAEYDLVPVEGNPFAPKQSYELKPTLGDPFKPQEPSFWRNTVTAVGRGLGGLLDNSSQGELVLQQGMPGNRLPPEAIPKPGEIAASVLDQVTGGNPYRPQEPLGRIYQNSVAGSIEGAPLATLGPMGLWPFMARQAANIGSNVGGEFGESIGESYGHPNIGRAIGAIGGGLAGGGLVPKPSMSASEAERILTQQGGYYTPARIGSMTDLNKVQAATKIVSNTPAVPGLLSQAASGIGNFASTQYNKLPAPIKATTDFLGKYAGEGLGLGGGLMAAEHPQQALEALTQAAGYSPYLLGLLAPYLMYRGTKQLPQAGAAMSTGLFPMIKQQNEQ